MSGAALAERRRQPRHCALAHKIAALPAAELLSTQCTRAFVGHGACTAVHTCSWFARMPGDANTPASSWAGFIGCALGAAVLGGIAFTGSRRARRVAAARGRLGDLLCTAAAGGNARIVITGATSGVGEELALEFGRHSSVSLLLGCRDTQRGEAVAARCALNSHSVVRECIQ